MAQDGWLDHVPLVGRFDDSQIYWYQEHMVVGDRAYYLRNEGVHVLDITNPAAPARTDSLPSDCRHLAATGDRLYLATWGDGTLIYDTGADPLHPDSVGVILDPPSPGPLEVVGDWLLLAGGEDEDTLDVWNVTDPANPARVNRVGFPNRILRILADGSWVYVLHRVVIPDPDGFSVVDFSVPATASIVGSVPITRTNLNRPWLSLDNGLLFTEDSGYLAVIDPTVPTDPQLSLAPSVSNLFYVEDGVGWGIGNGLEKVDLSDPHQPELIGNAALPLSDGFSSAGHFGTISGNGQYVFVNQGAGGFRIYDALAPAALVPSLEVPGFPCTRFFAREGTLGYASGVAGVEILDLSGPGFPVSLGGWNLPTGGEWAGPVVARGGGELILGARQGMDAKLYFLDVTNPEAVTAGDSALIQSGYWSWVQDIADADSILYLSGVGENFCTGYGWTVDLRIQPPSVSVFSGGVGLCDHASAFWGPMVQLVGGYLYKTAYRRLHVYDLADPTLPTRVADIDLEGNFPVQMELDGNYLYLTVSTEAYSFDLSSADEETFEPGIWIYDVSLPESPVRVAYVPTTNGAERLRLVSGRAYVGVKTQGIHAYDLTDPLAPVFLGHWAEASSNFEVIGDRIYALTFWGRPRNWDSGCATVRGVLAAGVPGTPLGIVPGPDDLGSILHLRVFPNPSRGPVQVRFHLAVAGPVSASVFDVQGQLIRDLPQAWFPPGDHELLWDGRNERGEGAAPGVYWLRVKTDGGVGIGRVIRLD